MTVRPQRHGASVKEPFSRRIDTKAVTASPAERSVEASPAECEAVAAATDLPALHALTAHYTLRRLAGGRIALKGRIEAKIEERCVVSLELFACDINQDVDLIFAPADPPVAVRNRGRHADHDDEVAVVVSSGAGNDDQADPPDPMVDDIIDLGVVTVEFLSLARDPYPRKPDAAFDDVVADTRDAPPSPFAALASLKDRS